MATITSLGIGSGIDLNSLMDQIVAAERSGTETRLDSEQANADAEISAFGRLSSDLSIFQSSLSSLRSSSSLKKFSTSVSDSTVFSATTSSVAQEMNSTVVVDKLARAHSLVSSTGFVQTDAIVGTGTLTIRFGTTTYDSGTDTYSGFSVNAEKSTQTITVDATNNTLAGLRDHINQNDYGVRASVVDDGSGFRLVLTSDDAGAANSLEITASGGDGGLSILDFNSTATTAQQTVAGQDAELTVDGLAITRESNTVSGAISGVTLNLTKADPGQSVNLSVTRDTASVSTTIESFVSAYNGLISTAADLQSFDPNGETAPGVLLGDPTLRLVINQVSNLISGSDPNLTGSVRALADLGISVQYGSDTFLDGQLDIDDTVLSRALADSADDVASLFAKEGHPTDSLIVFNGSSVNTEPGNFAVNITQMATQGVLNGDTVLPADFAASPLEIDSDNDTFTVRVDGVLSSTISLTLGSYTSGTALASEIQAQINADSNLLDNDVSVAVSYDSGNNRFDLTSTAYGSGSTLVFSSVGANSQAELGFHSGATTTGGKDVAGTINGQSAAGYGKELVSDAGDSSGLRLLITGGATGDRGTVSFSVGLAGTLDELLSSYLDKTDGIINNREIGLQDDLDDIADRRETLDLRIETLEERLVKQFSSLDGLIAEFQTTGNFLTQQLANLPGFTYNQS